MQGTYTAIFEAAAHTNAITLLELQAPSTGMIELLRASISQSDVTTDDNAEALLLRYDIGITGTSASKIKHSANSQAAAATAKHTATGEGSTNIENIVLEGFSVLAGWTWLPTPEERIWVPPSAFIGLKLNVAITAANLIASLTWREY